MENRFFSFISPALKVIDNGKFFREPLRWLYFFLAGLNVLMPLAVIYYAAKYSDFLDNGFLFFLGFLLLFLVVCFTSWVGFQIWWSRAGSIRLFSSEGDENFATIALSHLLQTLGEWLGALIALNGFFGGLFLLLGELISVLLLGDGLPLGTMGMGVYVYFLILLGPLSGFLVIVITRFLAEQIRALASVANYTRKLLKIQLRRIRIIEKNHWD
jgi:Na+-transporting methylmalonyl-CoA/oxaloacetate decarboxylase gamma subunit